MIRSLKRIDTERLYYFLFTSFIFLSAVFCGYTRVNNVFHLSALTFTLTLCAKKKFRDHLFQNKTFVRGIILSAAFLLFFSLSNLWGENPKNTESALTHSLYLVVFLAMLVTLYNSDKRALAIDATIFGFVILAIYLMLVDYQHLLINRLNISHSPGPSNVIDVGGYFAIGIILSFVSFKDSKKHIYIYTAFVLFIALLLTQSRGPLIGLVISLAITSHYTIFTKKNVPYYLLAIVVIAVVLFYSGITEMVLKRFEELTTQIYLRTSIWEHSYEIIKQAPLLGYGFEKELSFINYSGEHITTTHSLYLGVLLKGGIVGLAIFLSLLFYGFLRAIHFIRNEKRLEAALFLFTLIFYLSQGIFNISNPSEAWYLFWFPLGIMMSNIPQKNQGDSVN